MAKEICGEGFLEVRKTRRVNDFSATVLSEVVFFLLLFFFFCDVDTREMYAFGSLFLS